MAFIIRVGGKEHEVPAGLAGAELEQWVKGQKWFPAYQKELDRATTTPAAGAAKGVTGEAEGMTNE